MSVALLAGGLATAAQAPASASTATPAARSAAPSLSSAVLAADSPWNTGRWGQIVSNNNGQCVRASGVNEGASVAMYSYCAALPAYAPLGELWTPDPVGGGWFRLRHLDSGKCLVVPTWNGNNPILYTCSSFADQYFRFTVDSLRTQIQQQSSGLCLVGSPAWKVNGLAISTCADFADQYWNYKAAEYDVEVNNAPSMNMVWAKFQARRAANCGIERRFQYTNLTWTPWYGDTGGCTRYRITGALAPGGKVQIFVRGTNDRAYTAWQGSHPLDAWSAWLDLGSTIGTPVEVGRNADGRLQIFVRNKGDFIETNFQPLAGNYGFWNGWQTMRYLNWPDYARGEPIVFEEGQGADRRITVYAEFYDGLTRRQTQLQPDCSSTAIPGYCWTDWILV